MNSYNLGQANPGAPPWAASTHSSESNHAPDFRMIISLQVFIVLPPNSISLDTRL